MTELDGRRAVPSREPHFGGFLFWYVAIQVFAVSVFLLAVGVYSFVGGYLHFLDPQEWTSQLTHAESAIQGGATLLALLLCVRAASAHRLGFWRGVGGWFVGNLLGTLVMLPVLIVSEIVSDRETAAGFYGLVALCLLYAIGSAAAMIWKRRRAARALSERGLMRVFE